MPQLSDNAILHRFEMEEKGLIAFANYRRSGDNYNLTHVESPMALRNTGTAGRLMEAIVDHARTHALTLTPSCSYAVAWFRRHPDAADVKA